MPRYNSPRKTWKYSKKFKVDAVLFTGSRFELNSSQPKSVFHQAMSPLECIRSKPYLDEFGHCYSNPSRRPDLFVTLPY